MSTAKSLADSDTKQTIVQVCKLTFPQSHLTMHYRANGLKNF